MCLQDQIKVSIIIIHVLLNVLKYVFISRMYDGFLRTNLFNISQMTDGKNVFFVDNIDVLKGFTVLGLTPVRFRSVIRQ